MLDTVTNSAPLKSIFSKSLIISLAELFQTSASSQDEVTVTILLPSKRLVLEGFESLASV